MVPTVEAFEVDGQGRAVAERGPHRVVVEPDLWSWGAVQIEGPEGVVLPGHLLGLADYDPARGQSVMFGQPRSTVGALAHPNQVVWERLPWRGCAPPLRPFADRGSRLPRQRR
jgi:hypothetical protein